MTAITITANNANNNGTARKRRVCIFGTSANPPTGKEGHVGIVHALSQQQQQQYCFDEIRVVPVYSHPFSSKRKQLAPFEHRMKLCQLAFGNIPKVTISNAEQILYERKAQQAIQQQQTTSSEYCDEDNHNHQQQQDHSISVGTADLLEFFHDEECTLCLGADTFLDLTSGKWQRTQDILDMCQGRFVVLYRKIDDSTDNSSTSSTSSSNNNSEQDDDNDKDEPCPYQTKERLQDEIQKLNDKYGEHNAQLLHISTLGSVSSTMIRTLSSASSLGHLGDRSSNHNNSEEKGGSNQQEEEEQQKVDQYLKRSVTPEVFEYMVEHQLYGFGRDETGSAATSVVGNGR